MNTIEEAIEDIKKGKMVVVIDSDDRENEGDVVMAAEKTNPEAINFMITHCKGLICVPLQKTRLDELKLQQMVAENTDHFQTKFTVSVDGKETSTGISAYDRSNTIKSLVDANYGAADFRRPGHIFPIQAENGGVLKRAGHTEAAVDLSLLAGLKPGGVICEIIGENGKMARVDDLRLFAKKHQLKMIKIADLISYRLQSENIVKRESEAMIPTEFGDFKLIAYSNTSDDYTHLAIVKGEVKGKKDVLVRVHSECFTGDLLGSLRCDCGDQLRRALQMIEEEGSGVLVYLRQEGRGIGLKEKLKAYHLQDQGLDTVEANHKLGFKADLRNYGIGANILRELGLSTLKLMTNNPKKIVGLEGYGLKISDRIPIVIKAQTKNEKYLLTKRNKLGHYL